METKPIAAERPGSLAELLRVDAAHRTPGVTDGLIPLEALAPQSWDFSAPTLLRTKNEDLFAERTLCPDSQTFAGRFFERYTCLQGISFENILVAGSSVTDLACPGSSWTPSDIDLFVYGLKDSEAATERVRALIRQLDEVSDARGRAGLRVGLENFLSAAGTLPGGARAPGGTTPAAVAKSLLDQFGSLSFVRKGNTVTIGRPPLVDEGSWEHASGGALKGCLSFERPTVEVVRTAGSITIQSFAVNLQVVLRLYASPSEILHGFDLGASAAGFDGKSVWVTALGRFAFECGYNVVDTTRRSATYEARLEKYRNRGFDLILPELDVARLPRRNLKYGYAEVADLPLFPFAYTKIDGNRIFGGKLASKPGPSSDYDLGDEVASDGYALAYSNLYRLVHGNPNLVHWVEAGAGFEAALEVLDKGPHLTLLMIHSLYDDFRTTCWSAGRLNIRTLTNYLPAVPIRGIVSDLFILRLDFNTVLDAAFAKQRAETVRLWEANVKGLDPKRLPWVVENPGGQEGPLTGSLNPIFEDPGRWYGDYLLRPQKE